MEKLDLLFDNLKEIIKYKKFVEGEKLHLQVWVKDYNWTEADKLTQEINKILMDKY